MDPTREQAAAFAKAAKRLRGSRGAPSVAKAMTERLGYKVSHQSIYQWENPKESKPETYEKLKALDDVLGAGGELVELLMPGGAVHARIDALEAAVTQQQNQLRSILRRLGPASGG